jgi:hypothetical protein
MFMKVAIASEKKQNRWSLKLLPEATACLVLWKLIQWKLERCRALLCQCVHRQFFSKAGDLSARLCAGLYECVFMVLGAGSAKERLCAPA